MTVHRPGLPGDLPPAELLWARWALVAVLEASTAAEGRGVHRTGHWLEGRALRLDDCGCTWWALARCGEGRYVLYGEDESSDVKWHEPRIDMLAGGPGWLPYETLRDLLEGYELGCVYWYEDGAWARAPYPGSLEDDGLDCGMARFAVRAQALELVASAAAGCACDPEPGVGAEELLAAAEERRLTPGALEVVAAGCTRGHRDLPAMRRALALSGLAGADAATTA